MNYILTALTLTTCMVPCIFTQQPPTDANIAVLQTMLAEQRAKITELQEKNGRLKSKNKTLRQENSQYVRAVVEIKKKADNNADKYYELISNKLIIEEKMGPLLITSLHYFARKHGYKIKETSYVKKDLNDPKKITLDIVSYLPGYDTERGIMQSQLTDEMLVSSGLNIRRTQQNQQKSLKEQAFDAGIIAVVVETFKSIFTR